MVSKRYFIEKQQDSMKEILSKAYSRGWITTRDGNISYRHENDDLISITPSGVKKYAIESIVEIPIVNHSLTMVKEASGEFEMHWKILQNAKENRAVVHLHPTHVVAAMYATIELQHLAKDFPEVYRYTKVGPTVKKLPATSLDLAIATAKKLGVQLDGSLKYNIVGQDRHGVCAVGRTVDEAFEHIERLNHICEIVLLSCN